MPSARAPLACSVLLLAGGQGRRMGGVDKGLIEWEGHALVAWITDVARPLTDDLVISCNRHADRYAAYADRVVADDLPDYPGPLAGIRAGLGATRHDIVLVLPCDAPRVDRALLDDLTRMARLHPDHPIVVRRGNQWEPLFCALPRRLQPAIESAWQSGERSPRRLWQQLGAIALECDAEDPRLMNFNSPGTLQTPH